MVSSKFVDPAEIVRTGEIKLRTPGVKLEAGTVWSIFEKITKDYPELNKPDAREDEQKQIFTLSAETPAGKQKDLILIRSDSINIASLEKYEDKVWQKRYIDILSRIAETLSIMPITVVHIDSALLVNWKTRLNHNIVIRNALDISNLFGHSFSLMNLLFLKLETFFQVDSTEEIVCRIVFGSDAEMKQNKIERYPDPLSLQVSCGVAKIGNFASSIDSILRTVYSNAHAIFDGKFKEGVIEPISRFIAQQELSKEKPPNAQRTND